MNADDADFFVYICVHHENLRPISFIVVRLEAYGT
jgi:hypothetical protein